MNFEGVYITFVIRKLWKTENFSSYHLTSLFIVKLKEQSLVFLWLDISHSFYNPCFLSISYLAIGFQEGKKIKEENRGKWNLFFQCKLKWFFFKALIWEYSSPMNYFTHHFLFTSLAFLLTFFFFFFFFASCLFLTIAKTLVHCSTFIPIFIPANRLLSLFK